MTSRATRLSQIGLLTLMFNLLAPGAAPLKQDMAVAAQPVVPTTLVTDPPKVEEPVPVVESDTLERGKKYSAIVMDYNTGNVLYGVNADQSRRPASTVKVMTAYLLFEALKEGRLTLDQKIPVSAHAAAVGRGYKVMDIGLSNKAGKQTVKSISVENALYGTIIQSGCDAAVILAEAVSGSEKAFVNKMNETAVKLGMTDTKFTNPDGLPDPNMHTTVADMAKLCCAVIRDFPEYYHLFSTEKFTFNGRTFKNHNDVLQNYPGADGIKTGYTDASGWNLTASAERNGQRVIVVVFGASTKDERCQDVSCYLEYGFQKIDDPYLGFDADSNFKRLADKNFYIPCSDTTAVASAQPAADTASVIPWNTVLNARPNSALMVQPVDTPRTAPSVFKLRF